MAMRMPPEAAQTSVLPTVNRSSLVFFGGLVLIVLNFYWVNGGNIIGAIFSPGQSADWVSVGDTALQVVGLVIFTLMAEYGGDGAGTFALLFLGALWLLWLIVHFGQHPASHGATANTASKTASKSGQSSQPKS